MNSYYDWLEEVDNVIYMYFHDDLADLEEMYSLDLRSLYEKNSSSEEVISHIQEKIEEEEY